MKKKETSLLNIKAMKEFSQKFVTARKWDRYHTPKNVAIGVALEASELLEMFQWLDDKGSFEIKNDPEIKEKISDEIGDILHYLIRLSTLLDIDLSEAFWQKMRKTEAKYPVELARGKKDKYTHYLK